MYKKLLLVALLINCFSAIFGQFLDFNLFRPQTSIGGEYVFDNPTDSLSIGLTDYSMSVLIPLKSKFDVDLDLDNIFKSKGLLDAFKKVINPKFSQTFLRLGGGYRSFQSALFHQPVEVGSFSAGISGIKLQLKSGKFRFLMYSLNVKYQEELGKYKRFSPSISGLFGAAKIFDYRTGLFYGLFANYFGGRITPAPVLAFYYKISYKSDFLLAIPYQAKYTLKFSNVNQSFAVSINSINNGIYNDSLALKFKGDRLNFQNNHLRFSSQTRFKIGKKSFFYLEAGWQDINSYQIYEGYNKYAASKLEGNLFVNGKFSFVFGKSLFNPSIFNMDL